MISTINHKSFLILLMSVLINCQEKKQASQPNTLSKKDISSHSTKSTVDIDKIKSIPVGFGDRYDRLPMLNFQETSEAEFNLLKSKEDFLIKHPVESKNGSFTLATDHKIFRLKEENATTIGNRDGESWYEYLGFYPSLNRYAVASNSVSESLGFSELELISKTDGKIYTIVSPGDDRVENPVPSPQAKYLAYYYNQVYDENNSFIGIIEINPDQKLFESRSFTTEKFNVHQIAWSGDDVLFIKTSSDGGKSFKYYKSKIQNR